VDISQHDSKRMFFILNRLVIISSLELGYRNISGAAEFEIVWFVSDV